MSIHLAHPILITSIIFAKFCEDQLSVDTGYNSVYYYLLLYIFIYYIYLSAILYLYMLYLKYMRLVENYLHLHNSTFKMYVTKIVKVQMPTTEILSFQFQITLRMYVFVLLISKAKL
jgi:hypothetical protein